MLLVDPACKRLGTDDLAGPQICLRLQLDGDAVFRQRVLQPGLERIVPVLAVGGEIGDDEDRTIGLARLVRCRNCRIDPAGNRFVERLVDTDGHRDVKVASGHIDRLRRDGPQTFQMPLQIIERSRRQDKGKVLAPIVVNRLFLVAKGEAAGQLTQIAALIGLRKRGKHRVDARDLCNYDRRILASCSIAEVPLQGDEIG